MANIFISRMGASMERRCLVESGSIRAKSLVRGNTNSQYSSSIRYLLHILRRKKKERRIDPVVFKFKKFVLHGLTKTEE